MQTTKKDAVKFRFRWCRNINQLALALLGLTFGLAILSGCTPAGPKAVLAGKKLLDNGDYPQAVEQLRLATRLMPTNALAFNYLGLALHHCGQSAEAERAYLRALTLDKDLTEVHYDLGCLYLDQSNRLDQAKSAFTAYTLHRPNGAEGWCKLGQAQLRARELAAADHSLDEAARLDPQNPEILTSLGVVRYQRRRAAEAQQLFARALKAQPNYAPALLNSAIVAQQDLNDPRLALRQYRDYLALKPPAENVAAVMAQVSRLEQQLNPIVRTIPTNTLPVVIPTNAAVNPPTNPPKPISQEAQHPVAPPKVPTPTNIVHAPPVHTEVTVPNKNPTPTPATHPTAATNSSSGDNLPVVHLGAEPVIKPAEDSLSTANTTPAESELKPQLPQSSNGTVRKTAQKKTLLQKLNPINLFSHDDKSASVDTRLASGDALTRALPEPSTGTRDHRKIPRYVYISPDKPAAGDRSAAEQALGQGVQLQQSQRIPEALQAYRHATQLDPSFYDAYYNLGLAASQNGNLSQALSADEMALAIQPESLDARYNFGLHLKQAGYFLDAVTQFEKILAQYPNESRAHLALGNLYAQQLQDFSKARQHYQAVLAVAPQSPQAGAIRYWLSDHPR